MPYDSCFKPICDFGAPHDAHAESLDHPGCPCPDGHRHRDAATHRATRSPGRGDRSEPVRRHAVAQHRPRSRRPLDCRRRQRRASQRVLLRRRRRRGLEDDRFRQQLDSGRRHHFQTSSVGAIAIAPSNPDVVYAGMGESCFRGNIIQGDGVYKTTDAGQDAGRMSASATREVISKIRVHPTNPDLVYAAVLGHSYDAASGARRLSLQGRRQDLGEGALPQRSQRRDRPLDGSQEPRRALRRDVAGLSHAVVDGKRRPGQRALQVDRRRHDVDRHHEEHGPAGRALGQRRRLGLRRRQQSRLRDHRERQRRRLRLRRCRRDLAADQRGSQPAAARVLLHAHLRRPGREGHGLRAQRPVLQVDRRRQDVPDAASRRRTATTTTCGSRPTTTSG